VSTSDSLELLVNPRFGTPGVTVLPVDGVAIGEFGVAGLAGLRLGVAHPAMRAALRQGDDSRILLFGTEGVTDRVTYNRVSCSRYSQRFINKLWSI
jgi:hypothetical protein